MGQIVQLLGAMLVLAAFVLVQMRRLDPRGRAYLSLNFAGSGILALLAAADHQWGFLLLEGVWSLVSLAGLWRKPDRD